MDRGDIFIAVTARDQFCILAQHIFYHRQSDAAGSGHVATDTQVFGVQCDAESCGEGAADHVGRAVHEVPG